MTPPNCWSGNSQDYGDSGGVEWQGEQGKGAPAPAPAPGPDPAPGPGPAPAPGPSGGGGGEDPGCVGVHCTQMAMKESWGVFFCVALGSVCSLYIVGGMYTSGGPPNVHFWKSLGGLVKDGIVYTTGGTVEKSSHMYEPVPRMAAGAPGLQAGGAVPMAQYGAVPSYQQYPGGVVVHGQPAQPPSAPALSPMQIMCPPNAGPGMSVEIVVPSTGQPMTVQIPPGAVPNQPFTVQVPASLAGTPGRGRSGSRSRRSGSSTRKKKADKEERVVVIDPKTGKKKVKRRVKKEVSVKKGKGRSGVSRASLE